MTIKNECRIALQELSLRCERLSNAAEGLGSAYDSGAVQTLRDYCDRARMCVKEAQEDPTREGNAVEALYRILGEAKLKYMGFSGAQGEQGKRKPTDEKARLQFVETLLETWSALDNYSAALSGEHLLVEKCDEKPDEIPKEIKIKIGTIKAQVGKWCEVFEEVRQNGLECWADLGETYTQLDDNFRRTAEAFIRNIFGGAAPIIDEIRIKSPEEISGLTPAKDPTMKPARGAFGKLSVDCLRANQLLANDGSQTTVKGLRDVLGKYEARLKDMMIFYKGLYDLIQLETSSRQLPPEFLDCAKGYLVKPFEFYQGLQNQIVEIQSLLAKGGIGKCLEKLSQGCERWGVLSKDFVAKLRDIDLKGAPPFVSDFLGSLDALLNKNGAACDAIKRAASDDQLLGDPERAKATLQSFLDSLSGIREGSFFKLYNDLSEAIRLQQILPSWRESSKWVATAKKGLKQFWEGVSDLITEARSCLDEVDDEIASQRRVKATVLTPGQVSQQVIGQVSTIAAGVDTLASAGFGSGGSGGGGAFVGASSASGIDGRINAGVARVLGSSFVPPRTTDDEILAFAQKLKTTLRKSVVKTQRGGSTVYDFQRGGALPTSAGNSKPIRGTQATLYQQASKTADLISELLNKLVCQLSVCDDQTIDFLKNDIRSNVSSIVAELGREGGALPQRVAVLFQTLGDDVPALQNALGIRVPLAIQRDMDIVEREENGRNFDLLNDSLINPPSSLQDLANRYAAEIGNASGTVLTNLVRTIQAIPYSLQEAYSLMDSVRFGEVDRRTTLIPTTTSTVEQLLSWIEVSVSTDWPPRVGVGDTREIEIRAVQRTANAQINLLGILINQLPNVVQTGVNRVRGALQELNTELQTVSNLAARI